MSRTLSNVNYAVAISSYIDRGEYAELSLWGRVIIPQDGGLSKQLFFGAQGVKFTDEGGFIGDEAFLLLLGDVVISFGGATTTLTLKGSLDQTTGTGEKLTYLCIDCKGYKEMGITADITLSDKLVRRVDAKGNVAENAIVSTSFSTVVEAWNDLLVEISLPSFEIVGLEGFYFNVEDAVFDCSDSRNAASQQFPSAYQEYLISGNHNLWRGISIKELRLTLPPQFVNKGDANKRVSFSAQDMLFDNNGVSGVFTGTNLLDIGSGNAGGWAFSIKTFSLELLANELNGAGFSGQIVLPIAKETPLEYQAMISLHNRYSLKVNSLDSLSFDLWSARATLLPNSWVKLEVKDGNFLPEAMLSGGMTIKAGLANLNKGSDKSAPKTIAELKGITFRELNLKTVSPYLMVSYFGYAGEAKLQGFPLSISKIEFVSTGSQAAIGCDVHLTLGQEPFALAADTRLEVVGAIDREASLQTWKYDRLNVSAITIGVEIAETMKLTGQIKIMDDDPVYGDGFDGQIVIDITKGAKMSMGGRAIFGKTDFHYWLVEGMVSFPGNGIPVYPPIYLTGVGGGLYYRMTRSLSAGDPSSSLGAAYVPDALRGMGFRASVLMAIPKKETVSGEATFEIAFNHHGGLAYIGFFGQIKVMGELPGMGNIVEKIKTKAQAVAKAEQDFLKNHPEIQAGLNKLEQLKLYEPTKAVTESFPPSVPLGSSGFLATMGMKYDFNNNLFHSNFDVHLNVAGILTGAGANNNAGHAVFHVEPSGWYLHLGTPTNSMNVEVNLLGLVQARLGTYFMTGSQLEASPPPPRQISDILGTDMQRLDYMRDFNALAAGGGFALGMQFALQTGDLSFLMMYANFSMGLGFDIMLKDYQDASCKGRAGPVGMDGWYANGQAYAYMQGEAGVNIKLLFIKKKIVVLKGSTAMLLQAKLPNPAWFAGYMGLKVEALGGLIKGDLRFKMDFGEKCDLVQPGSSPLDFPVISDMKPDNQTVDFDVFGIPQVTFTIPIGKTFEFTDEDNRLSSYRLTLNEFSVFEAGVALVGKQQWNSGKDAVSFYSEDILPPTKGLKATVKVGFEEYRNERWTQVSTGGQIAQETRVVQFTTGTAPDHIPLANVEYCYPVAGHRYFLIGEGRLGYVQLARGQDYLFSDEYIHQMQFLAGNGDSQKEAITYHLKDNRIDFAVPSSSVATSYKFQITSYKVNNAPAPTHSPSTKQIGEGDNSLTIHALDATIATRTDEGKVIFETDFATSKYQTLSEKLGGMVRSGPLAWRDKSYLFLYYKLKDSEAFDEVDLVGTKFSGNRPLVNPMAVLDDYYYINKVYPLVYRDYPYSGKVEIKERDLVYDVPPAKALFVVDDYLKSFTDDGTNGTVKNLKLLFPYSYNLYEMYISDFYDIRSQVANLYLSTAQASQYKLLNTDIPAFMQGSYNVMLHYRQPNGSEGTSGAFKFEY
ncbi:hypothetical protein FACS1894199_08420 [Bacteroidia bacterium]|nr:hypothetical protein FACS1894199_08420 [Bacteroidia bacterium]